MTDREQEVRRLLRDRHAGIEPGPHFVGHVIARLPRHEARSFDWAVRRILPVSFAVALALMIAVFVTGHSVSNVGFLLHTALKALRQQMQREDK